ncbi:hypothetical protein LF1_44870 [Rubripirellula obstinata]|uniref:DUF2752 domain-containing protein n=1 Tax=Rubripirellula obstinata TaxID=406547 RepID=A0A5B1CMZ1_9BACT|nr:DUF2752 domain-containing protein [Rubripirellula obstinata]KAA1261926.1 hypothetical protein LF1_44870 [Rubripirellula obstinata]
MESDIKPDQSAATTAGHSTANRSSIWLIRLAAVGLSILPLSLLLVARTLTPDPDGLGTHQQLGLPPCSMRMMFNIRCPGCGMTTSWSHFARGQWISSVQSNLGGFLLAILTVSAAPILLKAAWISTPPSVKTQNAMVLALVAVAVVAVADWAWRLIL